MRHFHATALARVALLTKRLAKAAYDDRTGIAAIEFAIVIPLLMLLFVGLVDLGIGVYRSMEVKEAAQAGAQYAVVNGFNASAISTAVTSATRYASIAASPAPTEFCGCPSNTGVTNAACGSTCSSGYTAGTYVTASAAATYYPSLLYSSLFPKSFALTAQSTVRIK